MTYYAFLSFQRFLFVSVFICKIYCLVVRVLAFAWARRFCAVGTRERHVRCEDNTILCCCIEHTRYEQQTANPPPHHLLCMRSRGKPISIPDRERISCNTILILLCGFGMQSCSFKCLIVARKRIFNEPLSGNRNRPANGVININTRPNSWWYSI